MARGGPNTRKGGRNGITCLYFRGFVIQVGRKSKGSDMKALVTGATGFVGPRLLRLLDQPVALSRDPDRARGRIGHLAGRIVRWDPMQGPPPPEAFA